MRSREPEDFSQRLHWVRERIEQAARRAGRNPAEIRLIAATKTVSAERLKEAINYGCQVFGENRMQEAIQKMKGLAEFPALKWHLLGPLQTNKAKLVGDRFALIHSIDRIDIAIRLNEMLDRGGLVQPVLLAVNIGAEPSKHGFTPESLIDAVGQLAGLKGLRIQGLMTIPPPAETADQSRTHFRYLKKLALKLEQEHISGVAMKELSMGMSSDFECAIEEGATMVRIGRALFGERIRERATLPAGEANV